MTYITLYLTEEEIQNAHRYGIKNAVLCLLCNATGTLWKLSECGVAVEIMAPFRTAVIWGDDRHFWRRYQKTGTISPCELKVEFQSMGERKTSKEQAICSLDKVLPTAAFEHPFLDQVSV